MESATLFKALGDPTRLAIVQCLAGCSEEPCVLTAGQVCCGVTGQEAITPNVSHHIKELKNAGLVKVERKGRHMLCSLNRDAIKGLAGQLNRLSEPGGNNNDCC